jgi:Tfp pilus assembly protein PilF
VQPPTQLRLPLWLVLSLALLSVGSARVLAQQSDFGNIIGEVSVSRVGFPPKRILVNLQGRGATIGSAYTDGQGRFGFYSLVGGVYRIVIQDDDYTPVDQQITLSPQVAPVLYVPVTLYPRSAEKPRDGRVPGSNPNAIDPREYTRKFPKKAVKEYEKGLGANTAGDSENAARHFEKSLQLAPDFYPAHNELGRVYLARKDFSAAQHEFEEAVRLNQSNAEAHLNLGNVFLLSGKYDDALRSVQEGLRRDPDSAVGQFVLGSIYERMGRFPEAEHALRQALQLNAKMSNVYLELVNLYLAQQKTLEARTELKVFLKNFPSDPLAPKVREVLARLEKSASERP